jgi:hypothetical protein
MRMATVRQFPACAFAALLMAYKTVADTIVTATVKLDQITRERLSAPQASASENTACFSSHSVNLRKRPSYVLQWLL